jgi:histidinol dehydrogenase
MYSIIMIPITKFKSGLTLLNTKNAYSDTVKPTVNSIFDNVKTNKDTAIVELTKKFDAPNMPSDFNLIVTQTEIKNAYELVSTAFRKALDITIENITEFHSHQLPTSWMKESSNGYYFGMQYHPLENAGLYVPGGKALYPSSVCMNTIPAKIAGVSTLVMTTPPQKDGSIAPEILVAAQECGVDIIIKAGGAQAIFGLALGTESIPKVDKIVGPGNAYVDCAKQLVYGLVDIDKPAGPSEVLVVVEDPKYAHFAAAELLTQCEHDPDANGAIISTNKNVLELIQTELKSQIKSLKRTDILVQSLKKSALYLVSTQEAAIDAINEIATEHLCLLLDDVDPYLPKIKHAGAIFCGPYTPVTFGDYIAGPNHVLPTAKAARFSSGLSVMDFMKFSSVLNCDKDTLKKYAPHIKTLTAIENLDAHNKAIEIRLNKKK